jgi:hypothetical protein
MVAILLSAAITERGIVRLPAINAAAAAMGGKLAGFMNLILGCCRTDYFRITTSLRSVLFGGSKELVREWNYVAAGQGWNPVQSMEF